MANFVCKATPLGYTMKYCLIFLLGRLHLLFRGIHYLEFNQNLIYKYASKEIYINCFINDVIYFRGFCLMTPFPDTWNHNKYSRVGT
jgi:hypothetical protein